MSQENTSKKSISEIIIAKRLARELVAMPGVSSLADDGLKKTITNTVFRRKDSIKGIDISVDEETISLDLRINVFYGVNIPQLSYDIQTKLKPIVEEVSKLKVKAINISVEGIDKE